MRIDECILFRNLKSAIRNVSLGGFSSAGRAPALQAGGRRFDPVNLHQHLGKKQAKTYIQAIAASILAFADK